MPLFRDFGISANWCRAWVHRRPTNESVVSAVHLEVTTRKASGSQASKYGRLLGCQKFCAGRRNQKVPPSARPREPPNMPLR